MLLRTLFALLLFAALGDTIAHAGHALAQAALRRQALLAVHQEIDAAAAAAQRTLAAWVGEGNDPRDAPTPAPLQTCAVTSERRCALEGQATVSFASATSAPSPCPAARCTAYLQGNDAVAEDRINADVTAQAVAGNGAVLARRDARLTFRTFRVAPYAALAGSADASQAPLSSGTAYDGGTAPAGSAGGTLIDVIYQNARSGKELPANVWQAQVQHAGSAPAWSP